MAAWRWGEHSRCPDGELCARGSEPCRCRMPKSRQCSIKAQSYSKSRGRIHFACAPIGELRSAAWLALASRSWKRCVGGVAGFSMAGLSAAILTAASSNNIAKAIYAPGFGEVEFSRRSALMLFVLAILGFAAAAVYALPRSASSISNRRCIRITCNLLECAAVYDFQMPSVPALDDTARGQTCKCSAHGLKRHSNVFANI